jgi:RHS repeat-associated protein
MTNSGNQDSGSTLGSATATVYSYDAMGRPTLVIEQTPSTAPGGLFINYTYDLAGNLTSNHLYCLANSFPGCTPTFQTGTSLTFGYDGASRLTGITSSLNDSQHPPALYTVDPSLGYWPTGALRQAQFGNGLTESLAFNNRLQPCRMNVNSTDAYFSQCSDSTPATGNILDLTMGYNTGADNGNVYSWSAVGQQTFNRTYGYDKLNRILNMTDTATNQPCQKMSWTIDAWGNMTNQTGVLGTCYNLSVTVGTNNQFQGYSYDLAGNMIYDGFNYVLYDAENRSFFDGNVTTYSYNENGQRVRKDIACPPHVGATCTKTFVEYIYGPNGQVQAEWNGTAMPFQYVYAGKLIAEYTDTTTQFIHSDHLGSTRLVTGVGKDILSNIDYLPFGQEAVVQATATTHKFTGKERDAESSLDNFGARYNASTIGRFTSPDGPLIYADKSNPQSWNLYSYVMNNPLSRVDPNGHLTIVVPGTGWDSSNWNMNMKLITEAKAQFHDDNVRILGWTGDMGSDSIHAGASLLKLYVDEHAFADGEQLNVIAHSRGSEVALDGSLILDRPIDNLITLSATDWSQDYNMDNILNWINVSTKTDPIVGMGSNRDPKNYPGANNLMLNAPKGVNVHSSTWQNDQLRSQWWAYWQQQAACHEWFDSSTNTVHGCP